MPDRGFDPLNPKSVEDMKKRSPLLHWLFALTGVYAYVWTLRLMNDVNRLAGERRFPVRSHALCLTGLLLTYFAVFGLLTAGWLPESGAVVPLCTVLCAGILGYWFWLITAIGAEMRHLGVPRMASAGEYVVWSCVLVLSLPMLQRRMNAAIDSRAVLASAPAST